MKLLKAIDIFLLIVAAVNAAYQILLAGVLIVRILHLQKAGTPAQSQINELNVCILWLLGSIVLIFISKFISEKM